MLGQSIEYPNNLVDDWLHELTVPGYLLWLVPLGWVGSTVLGSWLAGRPSGLRVLGRAAVAGALLLVAAGAFRSARREQPDQFVRALEMQSADAILPAERWATLKLANAELRRGTDETSCAILVVRGGNVTGGFPYSCPAQEVRVDPRGRFWLRPMDGSRRLELEDGSGGAGVATVRDYARVVSVPRAWLTSGALGALLALGAVLLGAHLRRRAHATEQAREAEHTGDGWLRIGTRLPLMVPAAASLPIGPVLVSGKIPTRFGYRDGGAVAALPVKVGTRDAEKRHLLDLELMSHGFALGVLALTATPLATCAVFGLVV
jgi:hypothetical protein